MTSVQKASLIGGGLFLSLVAPFLLPQFATQLTMLWLMVVFALTWDTLGGQMGYNSFGNILFFGIGAYACAVLQRDLGFDYFTGLAIGLAFSAFLASLVAIFLGFGMLGLRGHYFAIGTLGLGITAGEIAGGWDYLSRGRVRHGAAALSDGPWGTGTVLLFPDVCARGRYLLCTSGAVCNQVRARPQRHSGTMKTKRKRWVSRQPRSSLSPGLSLHSFLVSAAALPAIFWALSIPVMLRLPARRLGSGWS